MKIEFDKKEMLAIIKLVGDHLQGRRDAMSQFREIMMTTVLPLIEQLGAGSSPFGFHFGRPTPTEGGPKNFSIDEVLDDLPGPEDYGNLAQEHDQTLQGHGMWMLQRLLTQLPLDVRRAVREGKTDVVYDLPLPGEKVDQMIESIQDTLQSYREELLLKGLNLELKHHYTEGFDRSLVVSFTGPVGLAPEGSQMDEVLEEMRCQAEEGGGGSDSPEDETPGDEAPEGDGT